MADEITTSTGTPGATGSRRWWRDSPGGGHPHAGAADHVPEVAGWPVRRQGGRPR